MRKWYVAVHSGLSDSVRLTLESSQPQKPSPIDDESYEPQDYEDEEDAYQHHSASGGGAKKKKRKARVYCVCKGSSFGNMIACDNRKCLDRSNWYHMRCVGLDASRDPPETWFCPSCQEKDLSEIPENRTWCLSHLR